MNRKIFLAGLGASLTSILMPKVLSAAVASTKSIAILHAEIRGLYYYDYKKTKGILKTGDQLRVQSEPTNEHDDKAVEVWWGDYKLGYLPREHNLAAANFLAQNLTLQAVVTNLDKWEVGVEVRVNILGIN